MKEKLKVPKLRFKEFSGEWEEKRFEELYYFKTTNSLSRENLNYQEGIVKNIHYGDIHTKFRTRFDVTKEIVPYINAEIDLSRISDENYVKEGDLLIADASENYDDIGKTIEVINTNNEKVLGGLHTLLAKPIADNMYLGFPSYLMKSHRVYSQIRVVAQGTKVLSLSTTRVNKITLNIPSLPEQQKIADFLSNVDEKIEKLTKKKELLEQYKKGVMQKIFSQELRFKDDNGNDFPEWEEKELGDCLDYIQPTNYIVESTEYDNKYDIPVLTAGKSFILGYTNEEFGIFKNSLPVIIFDDFTTSSHFVDFKFKVKSSAMKILTIKGDNNIKYIYEAMKNVKYIVGGHERHWISKYSFLTIQVPSLPEQQKIANFLSTLDKKIDIVDKELGQVQEFKKGLLQQMFV